VSPLILPSSCSEFELLFSISLCGLITSNREGHLFGNGRPKDEFSVLTPKELAIEHVGHVKLYFQWRLGGDSDSGKEPHAGTT